MSLREKTLHLFHVEQAGNSLQEYARILLDYNTKVNLVSRSTSEEFNERHLFPCMASALVDEVWKEDGIVYDVGTGGGLPGIPLAIIRPDLSVHLVESRIKKVAFLLKAKNHLSLKNVFIEHQRVEEIEAIRPASTIVARFFGDIPKLVSLTSGLRDNNTELLVFKGNNEELPDRVDVYRLSQRIALLDDKILAHYVQ